MSYNLEDLAAFDLTPIEPAADLLSLSRDNTQLLVNKLFTSLPLEQVVDKIKMGGAVGSGSGGATTVAVLRGNLDSANNSEMRKPFIRLPRQKPVPKAKEPTRWEKFAAEKGIQKKKRSKMVIDEETGEWGRRWGHGSLKEKKEKRDNWLVVEKQGEKLKKGEDPFASKSVEKKLDVAKQKMRELRNKVESAGYKMLPAKLEGRTFFVH